MKNQANGKLFSMVAVLAALVSFNVLAADAPGPEQGSPPPLGVSSDVRLSELLGASDHLGVAWESLYSMNGYDTPRGRFDFVDLHGGIGALVLEDNFSAGVAVDMSAYAGAGSLTDAFVYNGTVAPEHDLGNAYVYTTFDGLQNLVLYVGVERLERRADTSIAIELNQEPVGVAGGVPWPLRGRRTDGDLLIRADVREGVVDSVEVLGWLGGTFEPLAVFDGLAGASCNGEPGWVLFCATEADVPVAQELWDAAGRPVAPIPAERMFEVGINAGRLLGAFTEYSAIQVKTPEDVVLGAFRNMGYWAHRLEEGADDAK